MADSFVLELCKALGNKLLEEGSLLLGVPEEANNLQQNLRSIQAVLADAERQEVMKDSVKSWIRELKDVAYDVEDVLDHWTIAEMKDEPGTSKRGNKAEGKVCFSCIPTPCLCFKQAKSRRNIAHTIVEINRRLDGIAKRKHDFSFETSPINRNQTYERPDTTPFGKAHVIPSQENARDTLIQKLVQDEFLNNNIRNDVPIISLCGMGGVGKTTLARLVYNDSIVKDHFPKTVWVCVSDIFDKMKVAKAVAEALKILNVRYFTAIQNVLQEIANSIRGKRFFLVLDDVWTEREEDWSDILSCLGKGDPRGSRILLTTRKEDVAQNMRSCFTFPVGYLSEEESWSLFSYFAFFRKTKEDCERVKDIARELVGKCKGLPLALEVLGRFMYTKRCTVSEWDNVLRSRVWETQFGKDIFPSLVLSYLELPSAAKRCFVFCSVFPKDSIIEKDKLIRLWMAQGYLGGTDQMEAIGEDYFNTLVMRSFFQPVGEQEDSVTMHDIVHDLAQNIVNGEAYVLDPATEMYDKGGACGRRRHLSLISETTSSHESKWLSSLGGTAFKQLRSLFATIDSALALKEICTNTSYLRVLDLDLISSDSETVVDDFGLKNVAKSVHLRYLRLDLSNLTVLPEEICGLHFLQTLDLKGCYRIKKLPKEIGRLTSLRHLLLDELDDFPKGLGRLSSLRTLGPLCPISSKLDSEKFTLEDLGALKNLQGNLSVTNLNQVADVTEAIKAELHMKKHIYRIMLEFGDGDASIQLKVAEALQPANENLEYLGIHDYRGRRCPQWIAHLPFVKEIYLFSVSIESLPGLGNLRFLEKLTVMQAEEVKYVGAEFLGKQEEENVFFPKLSFLGFGCMRQWKLWEYPSETMRNRVIMPSLHHLTLYECTELRGLPRFLEFVLLETLEVESSSLPPVKLVKDNHSKRFCIGNTTLPYSLTRLDYLEPNGSSIYLGNTETAVPKESKQGQQQHLVNSNFLDISIGQDYMMPTTPGWIMDLPNLKEIKLSTVVDECLPPFGFLPSLEELTISEAWEVEKVGEEFFGTLSNDNKKNGDHKAGGGERSKALVLFPRLKKLSFHYMPKWEEWEGPRVQELTNDVIIMPSLCRLEIKNCPNLKGLPNFLKNVPLEKLVVGDYGSVMDSIPMIVRGRHTMDQDESPYITTLAHNLQEIDLGCIKNAWIFDWGMYCVRLIKLRLASFHTPSLTGLGVLLPSLETLRLSHSYTIQRLGEEFALWINKDLDNVEQQHQLNDIGGGETARRQIRSSSCNVIFNTAVSFPSLKELYFDSMPCWKEWVDPHQLEESIEWTRDSPRHGGGINSSVTTNIMPHLRILSLDYCPELKALPDFLRYVALEKLTIEDCDALNTWWEYDAGEDWLHWKSKIAQVDIN